MKKQGFIARNIWKWSAAGTAVMVLVGCAHLASDSTPEQTVQQRSADYWKARLSGDIAKAYSYMAPGYRALNDERKYGLAYGVVPNLSGGEVVSVNCDGGASKQEKEAQPAQRCVLRKQFTTTMPLASSVQVPIGLDETWIKEDGQWWLFLE